jgi:hypothetical protein
MAARWVEFVERRYSVRAAAKTKIWGVVAVQGGAKFGEVRWYSHWRRYCFFPENIGGRAFGLAQFVFDAECLREIADFAEAQTREHKAARLAARQGP